MTETDFSLRGLDGSYNVFYCPRCGKKHIRDPEDIKRRPFAGCHPKEKLQENPPHHDRPK